MSNDYQIQYVNLLTVEDYSKVLQGNLNGSVKKRQMRREKTEKSLLAYLELHVFLSCPEISFSLKCSLVFLAF